MTLEDRDSPVGQKSSSSARPAPPGVGRGGSGGAGEREGVAGWEGVRETLGGVSS